MFKIFYQQHIPFSNITFLRFFFYKRSTIFNLTEILLNLKTYIQIKDLN